MKDEIWKPIPGFEGYDVSNMGRVRSYRKRVRGGKLGEWRISNKPQRILRPSSDRGYPGVNLLDKNSNVRYIRIANLVLLAFVGLCPEGLEICHNDGNPANSRLDNLRYDTHQANMTDRQIHESFSFSNEEILQIRTARAGGVSIAALAKKYNVSKTHISSICKGRNYPLAPGPIVESFEINACRKLSDSDVAKIRELRRGPSLSLSKIAAMFDIDPSTVSKIASGARRAEVTE